MNSLFLGTFLASIAAVSAELPDCNSDRPNSWATHRTLYVPEDLLTDPVKDGNWADALCCVYTYVEIIPAERQPSLTTYYNSNYPIYVDTFQ